MGETIGAVLARYPGAEIFTLGDSPALNADLIARIRSGHKVATTGALRDVEAGEPLPVVGRRDVVLDWQGAPVLVIETLELRLCRFDEVTAEMALAEGEPDLAAWRDGHRGFFARTGGFDAGMAVVWERFALVADLA